MDMNIFGQATGPAGSPLTRELREGGEQRIFRPAEQLVPPSPYQEAPEPVQSTSATYFTPEEARSRFAEHLPIQATPNDVLLPSDDPRVYTYQMQNGSTYYLPAYQELLTKPRSTGNVVSRLIDNIPSRTEVEEALLSTPGAIYDSIHRQISGEGTYSDLINTAGGLLGVKTLPRSRFTEEILNDNPPEGPNDYWEGVEELRPGQEISDAEYFGYDEDFEPLEDDPLDNLGGWEPEPVARPPLNPLTPEQIAAPPQTGNFWVPTPAPLRESNKPNSGVSPLYPPRDYTTEWAPEGNIVFRSPVLDIVSGLQVPSQGIKGSQFIKMLQDNPSVRNSEVSYLNLGVSPEARYSREELQQLVESRVPQVEAYTTNEFENYQRQKVTDQPIDYTEIVVSASPQDSNMGFRANSQHYDDNALAHTRASIRQGEDGNYLLVEEMQSDLIQKGWVNTKSKNFDEYLRVDLPEYVIHMDYPDIGSVISDVYSARTPEFWAGRRNHEQFIDAVEQIILNENINIPDNIPRNSSTISGVNAVIRDFTTQRNNNSIDPPIRNTQESTRLLVESLISYADRNGVDEIVFPPLERIAAERFTPGTKEYEKAITPGSGFHQTYVTSLKKVLQEFQNEFGRNSFPITRRELPYTEVRSTPVIDTWQINQMWNDLVSMTRSYQNSFPDESPDKIDQRVVENLAGNISLTNDGTMLEDYINLFGNDFMSAGSVDEFYQYHTEMGGKVRNLPTDGVSINISALREQYNLSYPRFAEGGLVTQTKQAFGGMI